MPPLKTILLAASALTLTACAGGPPPGGHDRGRGPGPGPGEGPPPAPRQQVFISPAGEPFRTSGPAPYPVSVWFAGADLAAAGRWTDVRVSVRDYGVHHGIHR